MTDIIDEPWDEEAETEFVDTLLKQFVPRLENRITLLNLGGGSISELMNRQRKQFEEFDLLFLGLSDVEKGTHAEATGSAVGRANEVDGAQCCDSKASAGGEEEGMSRMKDSRLVERHWAVPGLSRVRTPATDLYPYLHTERASSPQAKQRREVVA